VGCEGLFAGGVQQRPVQVKVRRNGPCHDGFKTPNLHERTA